MTDQQSLRELKKKRTAQALRSTARDYFKRAAFEDAKLMDIARDVEVSATTVYNYFPTKLELLYAVVREDNLDFLEKAGKLRTRRWHDAVDAMVAFARLFFRWVDTYHRTALQALVAAAFVSRSRERSEYGYLDDAQAEAVSGLIVSLQDQRLIDPSIDAGFLGNLVFNLMNAQFFRFVGDEARSVDASCTALRRQLEFVAPTWAVKRARARGD